MARQPRQRSHDDAEQRMRDRELDAWLDRAIGARKPDPEPKLHDL